MGREQYTLTAQNEKYWHAAAFYSFPCILAYEYKKLQNLLLEQDGLGSLLKLKDIFEVLLKFPANIVLCSAFESVARQIANNKVNKESSLFRLVAAALGTQNGMTLGNWIELVKRFGSSLKNKINIDQTLLGELILDAPENKEILELTMTASLKVRRFIENNGVVGWRNEQIGHGASKHRDSEELITDIIDKTEKLKALMESLESEYDRLQLYTDSDILLSGYEISIQEYVNTNSFKIVDRETKSALFLGEILTYKKEKDTEYLFDSFSTNKKCAYYINYCYGNRDISHNRISALWNEISFLDVVPMSAEAVDEVKNAYIMKTVESIGNQQQFVEPVYMVDWLNHITDNYKAGVFLLQAEQGMGKTIFTKMVNEVEEDFLFYKPEGFEDFFIRTYNINDIYRYRLSLFKSEFHKLLINGVQQINGKYTIVARGTDAYYQETINLLSGSPHTALVQCAVKALPIFGKEAAIIILDAIDEIVPDEGGSLFDYIPDPGDVTDGVYIVLTSRTNKELTEAQAKRINALLLTEKKEITRDNKEYNETLYRYLKDRTGIKDMQEVQKIVDQQAHQQFLYVTHFARMYNIIKDKNVDIPGEKLPDYYLDYIKSISGSYYREFLKFVAILTMTNDAVTLDELVYLYGDDRITFKHMALLNDMAGFLTKTRSYRRTMYQLSHSLLRQQLINREDIQKVISELVEEYGHKVMEFIKSINNSEIDLRNKYQHYQGELWLLANYIDLKERYVQRNRTDKQKRYDAIIMNIAAYKIPDEGMPGYILERVHTMFTGIIRLLESMKEPTSEDQNHLARMYMKRGMASDNLRHLKEAAEDFKKAAEIIEKLDGAGKLYDRNNFASAYMNRGVALDSSGQLRETAEDYNKAIEIMEKLDGAGELHDRNSLACAYNNRGVAYYNLRKLREAAEDYSKAIEIREKLDMIGTLYDRNDLAKTYMNYGVLLNRMGQLMEAVKYYNKTIEIMEKLDGAGKLYNRNDLAGVYTNRGVSLTCIGHPMEAVEDYNKAIETMEKLDGAGKLYDRNDLAGAYLNRGIAYMSLGKLKEAVDDYSKTIEIMEKLDGAGKLYDRNNLVNVYKNRSIAFIHLDDDVAALEDVKKTLPIYKILVPQYMFLQDDFVEALYMITMISKELLRLNEFEAEIKECMAMLNREQLSEKSKQFIMEIEDELK